MNLKELIESALDIPALELSDPLLPPCATWYKTMDYPSLIGDGIETETTEVYEIDIWSRERADIITKTELLRRRLATEIGALLPVASFNYDINGKMWRGNIKFNYIKEDTNGIEEIKSN